MLNFWDTLRVPFRDKVKARDYNVMEEIEKLIDIIPSFIVRDMREQRMFISFSLCRKCRGYIYKGGC